jgi:hypothetical protein
MFRAGIFPSSLQGSEGSAGTTLPCIGSNVAGGDVRLKAHRDRGGRPGAVAPSGDSRVGLAAEWVGVGGGGGDIRWRRSCGGRGLLKAWRAEHCGSTSMYFFARDGGDTHVGWEEE